MAGDNAVCKNKIKRVVPVIITADFHAAKDISSDFVVLNDVDIRGKLNWTDINLVGYPITHNNLDRNYNGWILVRSNELEIEIAAIRSNALTLLISSKKL
jgi:hypothetical protein